MPLLTGPEALKQDNGVIVVNKYWFDRRRARQKKPSTCSVTLHKLTEKITHKNRTIKNPSHDQINTYVCVNIT